jgi:hypothetical protein
MVYAEKCDIDYYNASVPSKTEVHGLSLWFFRSFFSILPSNVDLLSRQIFKKVVFQKLLSLKQKAF